MLTPWCFFSHHLDRLIRHSQLFVWISLPLPEAYSPSPWFTVWWSYPRSLTPHYSEYERPEKDALCRHRCRGCADQRGVCDGMRAVAHILNLYGCIAEWKRASAISQRSGNPCKRAIRVLIGGNVLGCGGMLAGGTTFWIAPRHDVPNHGRPPCVWPAARVVPRIGHGVCVSCTSDIYYESQSKRQFKRLYNRSLWGRKYSTSFWRVSSLIFLYRPTFKFLKSCTLYGLTPKNSNT